MPQLVVIALIVGGIGYIAKQATNGAQEVSGIVKWGVAGGVAYLGAKYFKII